MPNEAGTSASGDFVASTIDVDAIKVILPSVLVLELEMSVLRIVNLYFYKTSSIQIGVPKGQIKL